MTATALVTLRARPTGPNCPFGQEVDFQIFEGACIALRGRSGIGKTTVATFLACLLPPRTLRKLHIDATCEWDPSIPENERCGVLFQQTTLLDELTVAGNLCVALEAHERFSSAKVRDARIKQLLESVGLDYGRDAGKKPTQLSGGMGRRASLALQLAQNKRVIVLDEPFTGLDHEAAVSVAKELVHLRVAQNTAFLLISHEPDIAALVMDESRTKHNQVVTFQEPPAKPLEDSNPKPDLFGTTFWDRFREKLMDYVLWSLPLICLTFIACGMAISMLSADLLERIDVTDQVLDLVNKEVKPLIKRLTGEEPGALTMMGVNFKVRSMMNATMPKAKATLFALGMTKLFVLEIGPLLTALLLCGRIGGSYAGKVATMQATAQNKLLRTLKINPQMWSLWPSMLAANVASPFLTVVGTGIALYLGGIVGPRYGIGSNETYWEQVRETIFPELRLVSWAPLWQDESTTTVWEALLSMDLRTTFSNSYTDSIIEIATYPPIYHLCKSNVFMLIIMTVAEGCARLKPDLTPRGVPLVITSAVVYSGLLVILADWAFSQLWLLRY
jgi:ABC-type multidrug transport system ATPase subunit/ABC-type transporter Mla maintaining outer membrane lipid asymmetry permease subunit MlaE